MIELTVSEFMKILDVIGDRIIEIDYTTGSHPVDPEFSVGIYITKNNSGDWTQHPRYSGVTCLERPEHMSSNEWIRSQLPKEGTLRVYVEPIDK